MNAEPSARKLASTPGPAAQSGIVPQTNEKPKTDAPRPTTAAKRMARARTTHRIATVVRLSETRSEIPRPAGSRPAKSYLPEDGLPRTDPTGVATIDASHHLPRGRHLFSASLPRYDMRGCVDSTGEQLLH